MNRPILANLTLVLLVTLMVVQPALASESGSYKTRSGDLVEWVHVGPTPNNPDGGWSWTLTCHHCGTKFRGTGEPPEWGSQ